MASSAEQLKADLIERFPEEKSGLKQYFKDIVSIQNWSNRWFMAKQFGGMMKSLISLGGSKASMNLKEYLDRLFDDDLLKAVLVGQWPGYGVTPEECPLFYHAIVASNFFNGGYYPEGGSQKIADCAATMIEQFGGQCKVGHAVEEVLIKDNRACGVIAKRKGELIEYKAPIVISNAGVGTTFQRLVPQPYGEKEREQLKRLDPGTSALVLYLGLNDDPRKAGFKNCNYWCYRETDYAMTYQSADGCFLSFGSLRDPSLKKHTAQIVTFDYENNWKQFLGTDWMKRGDDYKDIKDQWANILLDFVEDRHPGLKDLVEYKELSSPLSVSTFTRHPNGQIYGFKCNENRYSVDWSIATSIKNFYLTGSDVTLPGVNSALMIGVMTAGKLLGWLGMPKIFYQASKISA